MTVSGSEQEEAIMTKQKKTPGGMHRTADPGSASIPAHVPTGEQATPSAAIGPAEDPFRAVLAVMESAGLIPGLPARGS